jgi:predicted membrane protein
MKLNYGEEMNLQNNQSSSSPSKIALGIFFVLLGGVLLGFNFNLIPDYYWNYIMTWQLLLVFIGTFMLLSRNSKITGIIIILTGLIFYIPKFTGYPLNFFKVAIPLLFILIGASIIFRRKRNPVSDKSFRNSTGFLDETAIFSGSEIIYTESEFKGGSITAVFGGYHLDLTKSSLPLGKTYLEVTAIFGGVEIVVPETWKVTSKATAIFGAFEDKRHNKLVASPDRELIITGTAVFGGSELKAH